MTDYRVAKRLFLFLHDGADAMRADRLAVSVVCPEGLSKVAFAAHAGWAAALLGLGNGLCALRCWLILKRQPHGIVPDHLLPLALLLLSSLVGQICFTSWTLPLLQHTTIAIQPFWTA
jgi:hypothetical protein